MIRDCYHWLADRKIVAPIFIFIPLDSFSVGPEGLVVLHRILVRTGGTAGWDRRYRCAQVGADRTERNHGGPTGPTVQYRQKSAVSLQYHRYPLYLLEPIILSQQQECLP